MPRARNATKLAIQVGPVLGEYLGVRAPTDPVPADGGPLDLAAFGAARFAAYWFGQATTLIRLGDTTILTDPHFGDHAAPKVAGRPTGRRRSTCLPMGLDELPPIDVVLLSHAHMDHWEKDSLAALARPETTVVIPRRTRGLLPRRGRTFGAVIECHWDQRIEACGVAFRAVKPRHWGARYLIDRFRGYNAYLMEGADRRVVFAGDTGATDAFDGLGAEAPIDLAVLGIGNSYEPWGAHHATPEQAAAMAERMGAHLVAPIHHGTFHDPREARDEPLERFRTVWPQDRTVCDRVGHLFAP